VPQVAIHRGGIAKGLSRQVLDALVFEDDVTTVSRNVGPHVLWKKEILLDHNINVNSYVVLSELSLFFFNISFYCTTSLITDYKYTNVTINGL